MIQVNRLSANPRFVQLILTSISSMEATMFKDGLLAGKRILVTGAGSGLGREIAQRYLALGAQLYICGRRQGVLDECAAQLMATHGGSVKVFALDIRDAGQVQNMVDAIWAD